MHVSSISMLSIISVTALILILSLYFISFTNQKILEKQLLVIAQFTSILALASAAGKIIWVETHPDMPQGLVTHIFDLLLSLFVRMNLLWILIVDLKILEVFSFMDDRLTEKRVWTIKVVCYLLVSIGLIFTPFDLISYLLFENFDSGSVILVRFITRAVFFPLILVDNIEALWLVWNIWNINKTNKDPKSKMIARLVILSNLFLAIMDWIVVFEIIYIGARNGDIFEKTSYTNFSTVSVCIHSCYLPLLYTKLKTIAFGSEEDENVKELDLLEGSKTFDFNNPDTTFDHTALNSGHSKIDHISELAFYTKS